MSSIYLNMELKAEGTSYMQMADMQSLPDVNILKYLMKMILEPLHIG